MKKIAVMSDIHGNAKALETALQMIKEKGIGRIFICGDVVGYGKHPNECCDMIRSLACPVVAGNHDWAVAGLIEYKESFSQSAIEGVEYTKDVITAENLEWCKELPLYYKYGDAEFVHSSLIQPEEFYYLTIGDVSEESPYQDVCDNFSVMQDRICFVGHSHIPTIFLEKSQKNVKAIEPSKPSYELDDKKAIIVDVGSIGKPRNNRDMASFVVYAPKTKSIAFERFNI